jgi:hypothetical protein
MRLGAIRQRVSFYSPIASEAIPYLCNTRLQGKVSIEMDLPV